MDGEERLARACGPASTSWAPGGRQRLADPLGALGQLGARRADADPDLAAGLVQAVAVAPDDGRHGVADAGREVRRNSR